MLKVRTLFSGIGSPESALKNIGVEYELVDFCEIDKYAVQSYCAIHGVSEDKNLGDISKVWGRNLPYADLLVWGFPCTDISVAGKGQGIKEGVTRSGLYYEGFRILKETKPKYSIIENVKNLVGKKFKEEFKQILEDIEAIGYNNYWKVLNAKDYGIPQNRERVFIVSIRKDVDDGKFEFPIGFDNGLRLKDFLEDEVDEKFYIAPEKTEKLISQLDMSKRIVGDTGTGGERGRIVNVDYHSNALTATDYKDPQKVCVPCITPDRVEKRQNGRRFKNDGDPMFTLTGQDRHGVLQVGNIVDTGNWDNPQRGRIYSQEGCSPSLNTVGGGGLEPKVMVRQATKLGYDIAEVGDSIDIEQMGSTTRRGRVGKGVVNTLNTSDHKATLTSDYRIRKLTPKECWRLMGFSDDEFQRAVDVGVSNSQLYKQAGNSICVPVLEFIFKNLLKDGDNERTI